MDTIRIPYYYCTVSYDSNRTFTFVDKMSHPFIWLSIQRQMGQKNYIILFWKEITKEEYEYYIEFMFGKPLNPNE